MSTDATDRLANGEIGADAPAGQHTYEQAGSHDCELVVAPTGQGITASLEARAGRTLIPAESNFVQNMTTDSNPALTPSEEEVQKSTSTPSVQPQSFNGCTPEVASGSPESTLSNTSENKSEGVNLPAAAEGEPSAEAESGSSAATNSTHTKAMNANQIDPVSSGRAEEDAQGNSCVQTVQPSVEINACAASPGETEQIASPQVEPPSAVSTDSINSDAAAEAPASAEADNNNSNTITTMSTNNDTPANGSVSDVNAADVTNITPENAAALASANLNSGTDCATTSDTTMNIDTNTNDGIALASNGATPQTVTRTEIASAGIPLCVRNTNEESFEIGSETDESKAIRFTIKNGGATVVARVTIDDGGSLVIKNSNGDAVLTLPGGIDVWQKTEDPTHWQNTSDPVFLPEGQYTITGTVENTKMSTAQNNLAYFRYEVQAQYTVIKGVDDEDDDKEEEPPVCKPCACGKQDGGDGEPISDPAPGASDDECGGEVGSGGSTSPETTSIMLADESSETPVAVTQTTIMRYNFVWAWKAQLQDGELTIRPTSGRRMRFAIQENSSVALPVSLTQHHNVRVELQNADLTPCTSGTPAFWTLTEANGRRVRFETTNGTVAAVVASSGKVTTAADHAAQVQERFDAAGNMVSCYSPTQGLMLTSVGENGATVLSWFAPANVTVDESGNYVTTGEPYKTSTHLTTVVNGVETTTVTRQQAGLPPHTVTRVVAGNTVTVTKGSGEDAIIRTWVTTYPEVGMTQRVETVRKGSMNAIPASCSCLVRKLTEGGWLTISETEGYGTDLARTTTYDYNNQFRVSRINRPDGGYVEYEYDSDGRVTKETSPWGNGGKKRTRYVYNANSARFYDNRPIKVYTDYQEANSNSWLNIKVVDYTYETTPAVERTTSRTYAAGVSHQQVTIEETFGTAAEYAYAVGKPKFSQAVDGVQTVHEYEATTVHNAIHKHTVITKGNGELVAAQSRKSEKFIAADDTITFEQESIWDGENWLLLSTTAFEYDEQQRVIRTTRGNGRSSSTTWMCCGKLSETDEDGITTSYGYNSAHQLVEIIRSEVKDGDVVVTPETITTYTHDAAGRVLTSRRDIGAMTTTESTAYDVLGRVISQTDILGRVTSTHYSEDALTSTVTTPAGATTITQRNLDGSTARISGTARREVQYSYTRNGNNLVTTTALADGSVLAQNITNGFEQAIVQAQPNTLGGFIYTHSEYNAKGQMVKRYQNTGEDTENTAPTLLEYNSFGKQVKQTLALVDTPTKDNSPVAEMAYSVESAEDGVFSVTTQTLYNAEGSAMTSTQKQLISQLSSTLASKSISTDVRGNSSTSWVVYSAPAKVTSYSTIPTSEITAESEAMDGFTLSQKDHAGIITASTRSYTATGMTLVQVDGRGNATTMVSDLAGRTVSVTDATNATTTTVYDANLDQPAVVTDAMGNTSCYKYDLRGRKIAEWGTALQPACFGYDDMDNMTSLRTFRADGEAITTDPSERSDYDETIWAFNPVTGLEMTKTYADDTSVLKTYDAYNRLSTETDARGNVKTHSYEYARGLHIGTTYTEVEGTAATAEHCFTYNHLGQMTQTVDDAGTRSFGYNAYGERETDSLAVDGDTHLITETRDDFGRSTGYTYAKNGTVQQTVSIGYGDDGRICSAGFLHGGTAKNFGYTYLAGTNLLQVLTKPNGMTLTQTYEGTRNLPTGMAYHRGSTLVAQRTYTYDPIGLPTSRSTARQGSVVNDTFIHNTRSELVEAQVNGTEYEYAYDNIGNRRMAMESGDYSLYESNALNQYIAISENGATAFVPQFDADGNQTLIKTATGIRSTVYNAENRPITFTNGDTGTVVECAYDSMGRRTYKKVTTNDGVTLHQRYIYRGYVQIACIDLTRTHHPALWFITWDPLQSVATRPLAIQINGTWYTYSWDLTKNICELYSTGGGISVSYSYSPYGEATSTGSVIQPIMWSSEFYDDELGMSCYNFRNYISSYGSWITRDSLQSLNLYNYSNNAPLFIFDILGMEAYREDIHGYIPGNNIVEVEEKSPFVPHNPALDPSSAQVRVWHAVSTWETETTTTVGQSIVALNNEDCKCITLHYKHRYRDWYKRAINLNTKVSITELSGPQKKIMELIIENIASLNPLLDMTYSYFEKLANIKEQEVRSYIQIIDSGWKHDKIEREILIDKTEEELIRCPDYMKNRLNYNISAPQYKGMFISPMTYQVIGNSIWNSDKERDAVYMKLGIPFM